MASVVKKLKTSNSELEEFDKVKDYLLSCPHVTNEHKAIKAALDGLQQERKRVERDIKLQNKFSKVSTADATAGAQADLVDSVVVLEDDNRVQNMSEECESTQADLDETAEMLDWEDVTANREDSDDATDAASFLGKQLAKLAVEALARDGVRVKSPVAAIAAILHASMRSEPLSFACTGIPEDANAKKSGFAQPIRELSSTQLFPAKWDAHKSRVLFRYRKNGTGAIVLRVEEDDASKNITVQLSPTTSQEPPSESMTFELNQHINLDSWNAAKPSGQSVPPALHYKGSAMLLTKFCRAFDLGSITAENPSSEVEAPYIDATILHSTSAPNQQPSSQAGPYYQKPDFVSPHVPAVPSTVGQAFPMRLPPRDFPDDLVPAGLVDPRFGHMPGMPGRMGGNLMGPNHPMFGGSGFGPNLPMGGGPGTMQPRFDPFGPPGGPQDPNHPRNNHRGPRRVPGEPNPDHLPPPNSFNNDMFS